MRSAYVVVLMALSMMLGLPATVSAHVSEVDQGISAVLHILPDDNPVAGQQTYMQFSFGAENKSFSVEICQCNLTVNDGLRDVARVALKPIDPGSKVALAIVQFPDSGVYDLKVTGNTGAARGQTFRLNYLQRVAGAGEGRANTAAGWQVVLISGASLVILARLTHYRLKANPRYNGSQPRRGQPVK